MKRRVVLGEPLQMRLVLRSTRYLFDVIRGTICLAVSSRSRACSVEPRTCHWTVLAGSPALVLTAAWDRARGLAESDVDPTPTRAAARDVASAGSSPKTFKPGHCWRFRAC